jgi:hypothetical protein|tara:strand:- start:2403 stop:2663 length:261 start_codon:yes stop_codon:yes gene_type:complete
MNDLSYQPSKTCANYDCVNCEGGSGYEELQCHLCRCDWGIKICERREDAPEGIVHHFDKEINKGYYYWECKKCTAVKEYKYDKMWR